MPYRCCGDCRRQERQQMLNMIEKTPNKYFPTTFIWSFKNPAKVRPPQFIVTVKTQPAR
jgi:hypothetical protein